MIFKTLALLSAISSVSAFAPSLQRHAPSTILRVSTPINADLVTTESNIKKPGRTKPTIDPFNPEFELIQGVPYNGECLPSESWLKL